MKISAKTDYACRALLELSLHWPNHQPLQVVDIAAQQHVPVKFLTQILLTLKQMGYVQSLRGQKGAYLLARAPKDIKLSDVIKELENFKRTEMNDQKNGHILQTIWNELTNHLLEHMDKIDFEAIAHQKKSHDNDEMFEI